MSSLSGKCALVTGAGREIGRAIAQRLGRLGADVVVNFSQSDRAAKEVVDEITRDGSKAVAPSEC